MHTRKVQQVGGGTYTVSLPVEWAEEYEVAAGEPVYLYSHRDGSLVVRAAERERSDLADTAVTFTDPDRTAIERTLKAAYLAGFRHVELRAPDGFTSDQRRTVDRIARNLTGVEVGEETETRVTVEGLLDSADISVRQSVLQLRFVALSMHEAATAALVGEADVEHLPQRDDEADRVFELLSRHFNRALTELDEVDQLGVDRPRLFQYYHTARQLERVADHAVRIARAVERVDCGRTETVERIRALGDEARQVVEAAADAVVDGDAADSAHEALDLRDSVTERAAAIDRALFETAPEGAYALTTVLESVVRTAEYGGNIAHVAIQSSLAPECSNAP